MACRHFRSFWTTDAAVRVRRHPLRVRAVEFVADCAELTLFKLADLAAASATRRADDRGVRQLQHRPLAEGVER